MDSLLSIIIGVNIGYLLTLVPSKNIQKKVLIALVLVMVAVIGPELWTSSTVWRVRNLPALTTEGERALVAEIDKIDKLFGETIQ